MSGFATSLAILCWNCFSCSSLNDFLIKVDLGLWSSMPPLWFTFFAIFSFCIWSGYFFFESLSLRCIIWKSTSTSNFWLVSCDNMWSFCSERNVFVYIWSSHVSENTLLSVGCSILPTFDSSAVTFSIDLTVRLWDLVFSAREPDLVATFFLVYLKLWNTSCDCSASWTALLFPVALLTTWSIVFSYLLCRYTSNCFLWPRQPYFDLFYCSMSWCFFWTCWMFYSRYSLI